MFHLIVSWTIAQSHIEALLECDLVRPKGLLQMLHSI